MFKIDKSKETSNDKTSNTKVKEEPKKPEKPQFSKIKLK